MHDLTGRTCLITGASSGFGAHFAQLFASHGAQVVLCARRKDKVEAIAAEIAGTGGRALAVEMDVTDEASVRAGFDAAEAEFGLVESIVANAGISKSGRATDVPAEDSRAVLETNVLGVMLTAQEGARRLIAGGSKESGRGRILIIGSIGAEVTLAGEAIYCASKAAVAHLARNLAAEWVRLGINVNVVQPGYIRTAINAGWFDSEGGQKQVSGFNRRRLQPIESLNAPVSYFCSDASANTTGTVMTVDDGQRL